MIWRRRSWSISWRMLNQEMACRLFGTRPFIVNWNHVRRTGLTYRSLNIFYFNNKAVNWIFTVLLRSACDERRHMSVMASRITDNATVCSACHINLCITAPFCADTLPVNGGHPSCKLIYLCIYIYIYMCVCVTMTCMLVGRTTTVSRQEEIDMKFRNALVHNIFSRFQRNFAHIATVTPPWRVQNVVAICRVPFEPEHWNFVPISNSIEIPLVGRTPGRSGHLCRELVCIMVKWMWYNGRDKFFHITSGRINTWKGVNQLKELFFLNLIIFF